MPRKFQTRQPRDAAEQVDFDLSRGISAGAFGALVLTFLVGYLLQVNAISSKGFQIRSLENQISVLKESGDKLELKLAQEQSVQSVEEKVRGMGMIPTPEVQYISAISPVVAQR
jgi:hypothetical protein